VSRKIFKPNTDEVTEDWRKLQSEKRFPKCYWEDKIRAYNMGGSCTRAEELIQIVLIEIVKDGGH
jgi:hypothetical protein